MGVIVWLRRGAGRGPAFWGDLFQSGIILGVNCGCNGIRRSLGVYKKACCTGKTGTMNLS